MAYNVPFSSANVKRVLSAFHRKPNKLLGQNFLVDPRILQKIVNAANLNPNDTILEIGPGLGILTQALAQKAKLVIAVEKDPRMVEILRSTLDEIKNIEIVQGDILNFKFEVRSTKSETNTKDKILNTIYKVVANLPYYITSPVIRKFLEAKRRPELIVLMVQKEVAQRICARPPRMNLFAASVQFYAKPEIISYVKKTSFWPQPKVDSAIIKIVPQNLAKPSYPQLDSTKFFTVVRAGFKQPRKQLVNNLAYGLHMPKEKMKEWLLDNNLKPAQRAETLSLEDWKKLAQTFEKE